MALEERVGTVTHFYNQICVAVIELAVDLHVGDLIYFIGHESDFGQEVTSMQIDHNPVGVAEAGCEVAVKVNRRVRRGDAVYFVTELDPMDAWSEDMAWSV